MTKRTTIFRSAAVIAIVAAAAVAANLAFRLISIGAGYKSKILCSGVFVAQREPASLLSSDLAVDQLSPLRYLATDLDLERGEVTSGFLGIIEARASYTPGLGCSLRYGGRESAFTPSLAHSPTASARPAPLPERYDPRLDAVLDWAFAEPDAKRLRRTRAVVILHRGRIVAERYAPGFGAETPLLGWSMAKAVTNALTGIMVKQGRLSLEGPVPVPEWQEKGDPRGKITLNHLLQMTSGLRFREVYRNPLQDVSYMLLGVPDAAAYAADKPLEAEPGTRWSYSSGSTNIICRIIRHKLGEQAYRTFPRDALFNPLGMGSAVLEQDASGTFVGSSFMYATARDWAKFGQFYLQDGVWEGERILPEGWLKYATSPTRFQAGKGYGAHLWLAVPADFRGDLSVDLVPPDAFHAVGHEGQFISVIPSRELVLVRLGLTRHPSAWQHDYFIHRVVQAVEKQ